MEPRLIVIDLDETLVGNDLRISRDNRRVIRAVQRRGSLVTIATGRTYATTRPFAKTLDLRAPVICYQGAVVRTDRKVLRHRTLEDSILRPIIRYGFRERTQVVVYTDEQVFFNKPLSHWGKVYLNEIEQVPEISLVDLRRYAFPRPALKVMYIGNARKMAGVGERLRRKFSSTATVTRSRSGLLEFTDVGVSKGSALKFLADHLGVPLRRTMAIGDGYNDVSMFRVAGFSMAVANAPRSVEEAADAVTERQSENGVAAALEAFVLNRRAPLA